MKLPPQTTIGAVRLKVSDLARSIAFYEQSLGFKLHDRSGGSARLGAGGADLLLLQETPNGRRVGGTTGLYHFAVLVPSRYELGQVLTRIIQTQTPVQGFADHLVSEAIYLPDPDGNGIEIYRDRPRAEWRYQDGTLQMASDPIDMDGILAEVERNPQPWVGLPAQTVIGHMHLHVASLPDSRAFYCDLLGFDLMVDWHSALFIAAGGYHHHLGLNIWAGAGAPPPPADALGLDWYALDLPDAETLAAVKTRLQAAGVALTEHSAGVLLHDPAQNGILLHLADQGY